MQTPTHSARPEFVMVMVTAPDQEAARRLAHAALQLRLVACANIVPGLESHYWWEGKLEISSEVLIIFKTIRARLEGLEDVIREHHPYELPEFLIVDLAGGSDKYLDWILSAVKT